MASSFLRKYEAKLSRGMLLFASCLELRASLDSMRFLPLYENAVCLSLNFHQSPKHLAPDERFPDVSLCRNTEVDFVYSGLEETMLVSWENVKRTAEKRVRLYIILSPIFSNVEVLSKNDICPFSSLQDWMAIVSFSFGNFSRASGMQGNPPVWIS